MMITLSPDYSTTGTCFKGLNIKPLLNLFIVLAVLLLVQTISAYAATPALTSMSETITNSNSETVNEEGSVSSDWRPGISLELQFDFGKAKYRDSDQNGFDDATILGYGIDADWNFLKAWTLRTSFNNSQSYDALSVYPGYELLDPTVKPGEKGVLTNTVLDGGITYSLENIGFFNRIEVGAGWLNYTFTAEEHGYLETRSYNGPEILVSLDKKLNNKLTVHGGIKVAPALEVSDSVKGDWDNPNRKANTAYGGSFWATQWGIKVALSEKMWLDTGFSYELLHGEGHEHPDYRFLEHDYTKYGFYAIWGVKINYGGVQAPPLLQNPETQPPVAPTPEIPNPVITVTRVTPGEGLTNTKPVVIIEGTGFRPGLNVIFAKDRSKLAISEYNLISESQISCSLDLDGAATGVYTVTVTNNDGLFGVLLDAFTVRQQEPPELRIQASSQKGFNNGAVLITLEGPDLLPGTTVKLVGPGEGVSVPGVIVNTQGTKVRAFFNLKGQPEGSYSFYFNYPDGHSAKLKGQFEVRTFSPERYHAKTLVPVYFGVDKSNIQNSQIASLENDLKILLKNSKAGIILGGYTDERGSYVYNLGLSMRRVDSVKQYLLDRGVRPEQISTYAYGKELAKQGRNENVWQNDRRVDVIMYDDSGSTPNL